MQSANKDMAVRKIKNSWWVDLRANHTRYRKRSLENSKAGAEAYEAVLRQKLARGESMEKASQVVQQVPTFEEFAWKWHADYVVPNNKQQEQRAKMYAIRSSLVPFFGKKRIHQITPHDIERYKAQMLEKGLSRKTVNNRLAILRKCIVTAYEWLEITKVLPKIKQLKCPPPHTDFLSADERELFFSNADGTVREMILTALRTGMRQGEIRALQWSSIDWENRSITVRHSLNDRTKKLESPKSNRERHIPMDSDVYEMLFKRKRATGHVFLSPDNGPYDSQRLIRQLDNVREKTGLRKFTFHTLRHTFATQLATKGVPLHIVQALLGHSTIIMTMRYAHVATSDLRTAIDVLSPKTAVNTAFGQPVGNPWQNSLRKETA